MGAALGTDSTHARPMSSIDKVRDIINKHKVVIFSKTFCPFCDLAKQQFMILGEDIHIIELDKRPDGSRIQDALAQLCGKRSVPRCFVNGKYVGGAMEVKRLYQEGKLAQYCENCFVLY